MNARSVALAALATLTLAGCTCDWDFGEVCNLCIEHPDNPGRLEYPPGVMEYRVSLMDQWAAEIDGES